MKRVLSVAIIWAALFALAHRPALAMTELCPARLSIEPVQNRTAVDSSTFGFMLDALGPRTLASVRLAFDTTAGWYTLTLPTTTLVEKDRHYNGPAISYTRHDWVTPVMYVEFSTPLAVSHAWVYETNVHEDPIFGWEAKGTILCPPPPAPSAEQLKKRSGPVMSRIDQKDDNGLSDPPGRTSVVFHATPSIALGSANCPEPFREAEVSSQARPEWPGLLAAEGWTGAAMSNIAVALQPDGSMRDEWIWGPSGFDAFDNSALKAAKVSQYKGARAYCQPVPSIYLFRVTFRMP